MKHFFCTLACLSFLCFFCVSCEKINELLTGTGYEDDFNSLTDAERQEAISGTWKVIGASNTSLDPVSDGKEYHIPHDYPTKLSHIVTSADSMKFVFNSPVTLIIGVPKNFGDGYIYSWQDGPSFSVTEYSFAYGSGYAVEIQGMEFGIGTNQEEIIRIYTPNWMAYLQSQGVTIGGSQEEIQKLSEARIVYAPFQIIYTKFFSKDDKHACRLFLTLGQITYEMVR